MIIFIWILLDALQIMKSFEIIIIFIWINFTWCILNNEGGSSIFVYILFSCSSWNCKLPLQVISDYGFDDIDPQLLWNYWDPDLLGWSRDFILIQYWQIWMD